MPTETIYIVHIRTRHWAESFEAYRSLKDAEASIIAFAQDYCHYKGEDFEEACAAVEGQDHEWDLEHTKLL